MYHYEAFKLSPAISEIPDNPNTSYNMTKNDKVVTDIQNTVPHPAPASGSKGIWFTLLIISYLMVTLATIYRSDVLASWNFHHIVNMEKIKR